MSHKEYFYKLYAFHYFGDNKLLIVGNGISKNCLIWNLLNFYNICYKYFNVLYTKFMTVKYAHLKNYKWKVVN